jgi:predicted short-subunit dehydrogenase-like oxidoreductase (DUF2520 family)
MAWHPMQTFTSDDHPDIFKDITIGIDGNDDAVVVGEKLARDLGGVPFHVPPDLRKEYHLGAVIACNLLVGLVGESIELLKRAGMDEARAVQAATPLMRTTIDNISRKGLKESISGPILRGDIDTIRRHLDILKVSPETGKIYSLLSLELIRRLGESETNKELVELLKKQCN